MCVCLFQMNLLLKEYLISGDVSEAEHCLRDLEVPHFHHELVYEVQRKTNALCQSYLFQVTFIYRNIQSIQKCVLKRTFGGNSTNLMN